MQADGRRVFLVLNIEKFSDCMLNRYLNREFHSTSRSVSKASVPIIKYLHNIYYYLLLYKDSLQYYFDIGAFFVQF